MLKNKLREMRSALWFRPALFSLAAALAAILFAVFGKRFAQISSVLLPTVETDTVKMLLRLTAGGMLTMTTVTLSVLILVLSLAAGQASPRAVPELMADRVTQNALSVFLATFVFSLAALALLEFGAVEGPGVTGIFSLAQALMALALKYLVQWIHHVADAMKLNRILDRIQGQAQRVLQDYFTRDRDSELANWPGEGHDTCIVCPHKAGYVKLIDRDELDRLAEDNEVWLELAVREGDFVDRPAPLMTIRPHGAADKSLQKHLRSCIVVGAERSAEGDPLLGFELLAEVACRALSPSLNDPQSALICINYLGALLTEAASVAPDRYPSNFSKGGRVKLVRISFQHMLKRAVRPIVRDGAGFAEVICGLVGALHAVARNAMVEYLPVIVEEARQAGKYGAEQLVLERDREELSAMLSSLEATVQRRMQ